MQVKLLTLLNAITDLFNLQVKLTGQTGNNGRKTLEMPLINCETTFDLDRSEKCVIAATNVADQDTTFSITDAKLYVSVVTLLNSR